MSQPNPKVNNIAPIVDSVLKDIDERVAKGVETYSTKLQPFNGRNSLKDLSEELYDAIFYMKQWEIERAAMIEVLEYYASKDGLRAEELLVRLGIRW